MSHATKARTLRDGHALAAFAAFVVAFMVLVILEGAVVRATGSGNGCGNHWPLCNGEVLPHHPRLATIIEFTHRSLTGICTTLVAVLIGWTFVATVRGHRARHAAVWTGILLLTEGALGALLVKGGFVGRNTSNLRVFVQAVHFTNTLLLLAAMALTWWWLRSNDQTPAPSARRAAALALLATLLAGATGAVAALADTLFPSPSLRAGLTADFDPAAPLLIHMRWMHPATALLSVLFTLVLATRLRGRYATWLYTLTALQIALGFVDVLLLAPVNMQVLHLLGADLYWIALVIASAKALQREPLRHSEPTPTAKPLRPQLPMDSA
jgi:cytochrome c oxidase assembly protein subunit 15